MLKKLTVSEIVIIASLSAFSTIVQLIHIGYRSPQFGMWIDIVAVSWIIAFFLFGLRISFIVSLLGAIMITLFAPETWLGAGMKWIASVPILFTMFFWSVIFRRKITHYHRFWFLFFPIIISLIIRCVIIIPVNYFYAIPIWTGMTTKQAMSSIPWQVIAIFNIVQGLIDVILAWVIVYKFKLNRFSSMKPNEYD